MSGAATAGLAEALRYALGVGVTDLRPVAGGDIHQAFCVRLANGERAFVKTSPHAPADMFPAEARGLAWLAEAGALRVPAVRAVSRPGALPFLALEWIEPGPATRRTMEDTGRGLAALHRYGAAAFGLDHDNYLGRLPQANAPLDGPPGPTDWPTFWRARRLEPQVRMAADRGLLPAKLRADLARLLDRLPALLGPPEPPARLHGDLWGGNLLVAAGGEPVLIDPAAYGGHREADLAMMRLFGGFDARCLAAYAEAFPLAPGADARVPIYQLYYLLAHVNLFGAGYVASVRGALARVV